MDADDISQIIFLLILLALSAFFSSSETALTTVNKIRMRTLAEAGNTKAKKVLKVTENSPKMLSAILIGNNIVNLSASSLTTSLAIKLFGSVGAGVATGILTFLILIFGEVSPKTLATIKADKISLSIAGFISVLMVVLTPVIFIINKLSLGVIFLFGIRQSDAKRVMTEEELRTIVDVGQEDGIIEDEERDMIHNVFDFGDAEAKEVMVPRIDMTFVHVDSTYDDLISIFREDKFTRLPVYDESTDNVIGIVNVKDLLLLKDEDKEHFSIRNIMREPYFTYEHKNTANLFLEMRESSISLAIVLDEYGVTAGLITLEDLLEEIVGEIRDEYDSDEQDDITRINDYEYIVLGSANLEDVSDELGLHLESDDYDTIGGYCLEKLDHGIIEDEERDMIHNVFDFGDAEAKEVMVPRIDMTFVHVDSTYDDLISIFREDKFTRLPVYDESTDNVIGIVNVKDLLLLKDEDKEHFSIRNIMREPYFTYEHKNTANLFLEMRESSISLAIVLDEYGVTAGLITLEDLLEEIVGEIRDEYDSDEQDDITRINDYEYIVLGSANLEDVSDELGLHLESDDYDTIGGYCLEKLDHLPEKNEIIITDDNILLRIEAVDKNRIGNVYIKLPRPAEEEN